MDDREVLTKPDLRQVSLLLGVCGRAICTGKRGRLLPLEATGVRVSLQEIILTRGEGGRLLGSRVELLILFAVKEGNSMREGYRTLADDS